MAGHNKASWEQAAGQGDAIRWRAWVIWNQTVLPLLQEAEGHYALAEKVKGEPIPRAYPKEGYDADGLV